MSRYVITIVVFFLFGFICYSAVAQVAPEQWVKCHDIVRTKEVAIYDAREGAFGLNRTLIHPECYQEYRMEFEEERNRIEFYYSLYKKEYPLRIEPRIYYNWPRLVYPYYYCDRYRGPYYYDYRRYDKRRFDRHRRDHYGDRRKHHRH